MPTEREVIHTGTERILIPARFSVSFAHARLIFFNEEVGYGAAAQDGTNPLHDRFVTCPCLGFVLVRRSRLAHQPVRQVKEEEIINLHRVAFVVLFGSLTSASYAQLLHHYKCDELGGNTVFDSVGGVNGTTGPDTLLNGDYLQFNSLNDPFSDQSYINWGTDIGQFGTDDFAVCFSMRTTSTNGNTDLIGNRADGSAGNFLSVRMGGDGHVAVEISEDGNGTNFASVGSLMPVNDGLWNTVLVTRVGNVLSLSVNGIDQGSSMSEGVTNISNGVPFQAGFSPIATSFGLSYVGDMADIKIYGTIPAPGTAALLVLGGLGAARRRRA